MSGRSAAVSPPLSKLKQKRQHKFQPQGSRLDPETLMRQQSEFRGFFVFFWLGLAVFMVQQMLATYRNEGTIFRLDLIPIMSRDLLVFGLTDLAMLTFTLAALWTHKLIITLNLPLWLGHIIKHALQTFLVLGSVAWTFKRDWPWPQTGTFCLHSVAMFMKVRST
jgi:sterol O-acyltransferase